VLTSHDSLDVAEPGTKTWRDALTALLGELKYQGPLVTAGFIAVAAGSTGAALAGLIAAGVGGTAVKELLDELTARPHTEDFARALVAGDVLLWVYAPDAEREALAIKLLTASGGGNVHTNRRMA
jgi:hypothetical protein